MKKALMTLLKKNKYLNIIRLRLKLNKRKQIKGINNIFKTDGLVVSINYNINGNNNFIEIRKGTILNNLTVNINGDNNTLIINENCYLKKSNFYFEGNNCRIFIDSKTTVESAYFAAVENNSKIEVGMDCMFSSDITIRTSDYHSIIDLDNNSRINYAKDVKIGNHVWVGSNSMILKGVIINSDCIIATNSVVTKTIESNTVVAGIPAFVIKKNVTWSREK